MTHKFAVPQSMRTGARGSNYSSCSSTAAGSRRPSFRRCSDGESWTFPADIACDSTVPPRDAPSSLLLYDLTMTPPEERSHGAVVYVSVASSAATETEAQKRIKKKFSDQLVTQEEVERASYALLPLGKTPASSSDGNATAESGIFSTTCSRRSLPAHGKLFVSQTTQCVPAVPPLRAQQAAAAAAGTPGCVPIDARALPSMSSALYIEEESSVTSTTGARKEDASEVSHHFMTSHSPVVYAECAPLDNMKNEEARASTTVAALAKGATEASHVVVETPTDVETKRSHQSAPSRDGFQADAFPSPAWPVVLSQEGNASQTEHNSSPLAVDSFLPRPSETSSPPRSCETAECAVCEDVAAPSAGCNAGAACAATSSSGVEPASAAEGANDGQEESSFELHDFNRGSKDICRSKSEHSGDKAKLSREAQVRRCSHYMQLSDPAVAENASRPDCTTAEPTDIGHRDISPRHKASSSTSSSCTGKRSNRGDERGGRLSDKLRAKFKREFNRSWVDINSAPSWPPIKKTKYLTSDWKIVDLRVGAAQRQEKKRNRLFLNSLCYLFDGVYTQKSTLGRKAGLGLFCERPEGFKKGQIITEFVGWLVDREQAESYRKQRAASHIVAVQKGFLYIDGAKEPAYGMGGGSFANDGSEFLGGPGNNAQFYHWFDDELGRTRVFIRATADINPGQEIFVPYDRTYWVDNFEEQAENCPEAFRRRQLEQLRKKFHRREEMSRSRRAAKKQRTLSDDAGKQPGTAALVKTRGSPQLQGKGEKKKKKKKKDNSTRTRPKKPLSAYMLFSHARGRELLREYYGRRELQQRQQPQPQSSSVVVSARESHAVAVTAHTQKEEAFQGSERRVRRKRVKEDETPFLKVLKQEETICLRSGKSASSCELTQNTRRQSRRQKKSGGSDAGKAAITAAAAAERHNGGPAIIQRAITARRRKEGTQDSAVSSCDEAVAAFSMAGATSMGAADTTADTANAAAGPTVDSTGVAGGGAVSFNDGNEPVRVQTRRRSSRLLHSASPPAEEALAAGTSNDKAKTYIAQIASKESAKGKSQRAMTDSADTAEIAGQQTTEEKSERAMTKTASGSTRERRGRGGRTRHTQERRVSLQWLRDEASLAAAAATTAASDKDFRGRNSSHSVRTGEASAGKMKETVVKKAYQTYKSSEKQDDYKSTNRRKTGAAQTSSTRTRRQAAALVLAASAAEARPPVRTSAGWQRNDGRGQEERVNSASKESFEKTTTPASHTASTALPGEKICQTGVMNRQEKRNHTEAEACVGRSANGSSGTAAVTSASGQHKDRKTAAVQYFGTVMRQVSNEWVALSGRERRRWERLAEKQRKLYYRLKEKYSSYKVMRRRSKKGAFSKGKYSISSRKKKVRKVHPRSINTPAQTAVASLVPANAKQSINPHSKALNTRAVAIAVAFCSSTEAQAGSTETTEATRLETASADDGPAAAQSEAVAADADATCSAKVRGSEHQMTVLIEQRANAWEGKRRRTRAATYAALRAFQANVTTVPQAQEDQRMQRQRLHDKERGQEQQRHCKAGHAQPPRRGRRGYGVVGAAPGEKKTVADSVSQQKRQETLSGCNSPTCTLISCSTTRSSSSRNSSRDSHYHLNTGSKRNSQVTVKKGDSPLSANEHCSVEFNSVCKMLERRSRLGAVVQEGIEQRYFMLQQQPPIPHNQPTSSHECQKCPLLSKRQEQQQQHEEGREGESRGGAELQQSISSKGCAPAFSSDEHARAKRHFPSPPACDEPAAGACSSAWDDLHEKGEGRHTANLAAADEFFSADVSDSAEMILERGGEIISGEQSATDHCRVSSGDTDWSFFKSTDETETFDSSFHDRSRDSAGDCSRRSRQQQTIPYCDGGNVARCRHTRGCCARTSR